MTNTQSNRDDANKIPGLTPTPAPAQQSQSGGENANPPKPDEKPPQQK